MLIAHLSDLHIDDMDSHNTERLRLALAELARVKPQPSLLLITGDLTQHGRPEQYLLLRELLRHCGPYVLVPGNHDDSHLVHHFFPEISPPPYGMLRVELGCLRLLLADSCVPRQDYGELQTELLQKMSAEIHLADRPTLLAIHHPPVPAQVPAMEGMGLRSCQVFQDWLTKQGSIVAVLAGHYHQAQFSMLGRCCPVIVAPSVAPALVPDFCTSSFQVEETPVAGLLHHWNQNRLSTHLFISRHQSLENSNASAEKPISA